MGALASELMAMMCSARCTPTMWFIAPWIAFSVTATAQGLELIIGATALPAQTLGAGSIHIG